MVTVGHYPESYPGSQHVIRVDSRPAVRRDARDPFIGAAAQSLISQMQAGSSVRVRYTAWPTEFEQDAVIDLAGFTAVWSAVQDLMRR